MDQYERAVQCLYGSDPQLQAQANQWLNEFQSKDECWEVCLSFIVKPGVPQEFMFFSSQVLLNKVKKEWSRLTQNLQLQLTQAISNKIEGLVELGQLQQQQGSGVDISLTLERMCNIMGIVITRGEIDVAIQYVDYVIQKCKTDSGSVLQFKSVIWQLRHIALESEESKMLTGKKRRELEFKLVKKFTGIITLANASLRMDNTDEKLCIAALQCVLDWVKLERSNNCIMSAGEIFNENQTFYEALLQAVGMKGQLGNVARDLLCHIWDYASAPWGKQNDSDVDVKETVTKLTVEALVSMYRGITGQQVWDNQNLDVLSNIGRVMQSICGPSTEILAGCKRGKKGGSLQKAANDLVQPAAELMLDLMRRLPYDTRVEAPLDYFVTINSINVDKRDVILGAQLYVTVVQGILDLGRYPQQWTCWDEEVNVEQETFDEMRNTMGEAIQLIGPVVKQNILEVASQRLASASCWQDVEVVIFLLSNLYQTYRNVLVPFKRRKGQSGPFKATTASAAEQSIFSAKVGGWFCGFFEQICEDKEGNGFNKFVKEPQIRGSLCRMIQQFGEWFGSGVNAPWVVVFRYVLNVVNTSANKEAFEAFPVLCQRCSEQLTQDFQACIGILQASSDILKISPSSSLDQDSRILIAKGLAKMVGNLAEDKAAEAYHSFSQPIIQQIQQLLQTQQYNLIAQELNLLCHGLKHINFKQATLPVHPFYAALEPLQNIINTILKSPGVNQNIQVLDAVNEVYEACINSTGAGLPSSQEMISNSVNIFLQTGCPSCLSVVVLVCEYKNVFSEKGVDVEVYIQFILEKVSQSMDFNNLEQVGPYLKLLARCLTFVEASVPNEAVRNAFMKSIETLKMRELFIIQPTQSFLVALIRWCKTAEKKNLVKQLIQQNGQILTTNLLYAICDTSPQESRFVLSKLVAWMTSEAPFQDDIRNYLQNALQQQDFPGTRYMMMKWEEIKQFNQIIQQWKRGNQYDKMLIQLEQAFLCLGKVCCGEDTSDSLIRFQKGIQ